MNSSNQHFYEAFAPHYEEVYADVDAEEAVHQYLSILEAEHLIPPITERTHRRPRLLDIGCGPGWHAVCWSQAGFDVTCLDSSPTMLAIARRRLDESKINASYLNLLIEEAGEQTSICASYQIQVAHFNFLNLFSTFALLEVFRSLHSLASPKGIFIGDCHVNSPVLGDSADTVCQWHRNTTSDTDQQHVTTWTKGNISLREYWWHHTYQELNHALQETAWRIKRLILWKPSVLDNDGEQAARIDSKAIIVAVREH